MRVELGFSPSQVHGVIEAPSAEAYCAMTGDFDPEGIDAVVSTDSAFGDLIEVVRFEGVDYFRWGEDFRGVATDEPDTLTRIQRMSGRLYADDDRIYWGRADAAVEDMIAAGVTDTRSSLADDEGIRSIVDYFDDHGVYGGFLTDQVGTGTEAICPSYCDEAWLAEWIAGFTFADGIELWGGGWGRPPDGEHLGFVAVVSADADDTEANLAAIEANIRDSQSWLTGKPWSEVFEVVDSVARGRLGVVQLTYGSAPEVRQQLGGRILTVLFRREALVANRE